MQYCQLLDKNSDISRYVWIFRGISRRLLIYFKISRGTLVAKAQHYKDYPGSPRTLKM